MKLIWSNQAYERLQNIKDFISLRSSSSVAENLIDSLIERSETLKDFPSMGRVLPELRESTLREIIEGNYRIVYRIYDNEIVILTVFEGHKLLPEEDIQPVDSF